MSLSLSFEFQPGLLVWHSKDLRSWQPLARAVTNQPGSIWAPELIKHDGTFYMSHSFAGPQLGIQWQFFQQYDAKRLAFADGALVLKAAGTHPGDSFPLCVMPLHRAYEIETEVEIEGDGTAGLMLFFSPQAYLGLGVDKTGAVTRVQHAFELFGRGSVPQPGSRRVTLRIVNNKQDVLAYCRDAAGHWQTVPPALEVSGADHNTLGGWHCVGPALFACGSGQARFHSFTYRPLE